ncbi:hypothetical protein EYF80_052705 [Liparis tanakae]|uniref:Uncharacterized protein n=1 Tax=Liparis tanakae TaxID=230148 RepID=A0A4Z2F7F0_9TELE|nr:hypothetical protein EYF80_052705 [Liparis tanakae]
MTAQQIVLMCDGPADPQPPSQGLEEEIRTISLTDTGMRCMWSNIGPEVTIKHTPKYPPWEQPPSEDR